MTERTVSLTEWEVREPTPGSPLEGLDLAGSPEAQRLATSLTRDGRIEVLELARGLELRASSFVGRIALGDLTVTIQPKIRGAPLMNLLRYAYRLRPVDLFAEVGYETSSSSFEDLLLYQLVAEASELLARGLHFDYVTTRSQLANLRGRIDLSGYLEAVARADVNLPCIHHPRSPDVRLNQALHGGLMMAAGMTMSRDLSGHLRRLAECFAGSVTRSRLDRSSLAAAVRSVDRRTTAYLPALTLIQMLLDSLGAGLSGTLTCVQAAGFLFDMNRFFQALLYRFLDENLVDCEVHDERMLARILTYDPANNPRLRRPPSLRPDFTVIRENRVEAVLDAKYRDLWERPLPSEMLYQLTIYALGQDGIAPRATILYPTTHDAATDQVITVRDPGRGCARAHVVLRPVNLCGLDALLRASGARAQRHRGEFGHHLAFGSPRPALH